MSLSDLGNLGEFIGSVTILISLIYVGFQIRSNTRAVRASTFLGLTNGWVEYLLVAGQQEPAEFFARATLEPEKLDLAEQARFFSIARAVFRRFENDFFQYESGTFDAGAWQGYRNSLRHEVLSSPVMRVAWTMTRDKFSPEFSALVDREAEAARAAGLELDPEARLDAWKEALRREGVG